MDLFDVLRDLINITYHSFGVETCDAALKKLDQAQAQHKDLADAVDVHEDRLDAHEDRLDAHDSQLNPNVARPVGDEDEEIGRHGAQ